MKRAEFIKYINEAKRACDRSGKLGVFSGLDTVLTTYRSCLTNKQFENAIKKRIEETVDKEIKAGISIGIYLFEYTR